MTVAARDRDLVAAYYRGKTASILRKYGPGPRVHFHTGLVEDGDAPHALESSALRAAMVRAQDRLLERVSDSALRPSGRILDIGCGLGGSAIFLAQCSADNRVVAITNERSHVAVVTSFASAAGVSDRVVAMRCDAHAPPAQEFDAAIAIESSCYFARERWLRATKARLRPGGVMHVVDCLLGHEQARGWFDARWRTRIGSEREYLSAARAAELEVVHSEDLAPGAIPFWDLSVAWTRASLPESAERELQEAAHLRLRDALASGAILYRWFVLRRTT